MKDDVKRLVEIYTDQNMTEEGKTNILNYARGRLDAQREFKKNQKQAVEESQKTATGDLAVVSA